MKTTIFILLGLALSIGASAQSGAAHKSYPNAKAIQTGTPAAPAVAPTTSEKDYFKMEGNQLRAVKGGVATFMDADRWLQNETVVTPYGVVVTNSGNKIYLKDGETIDGNGVITSKRCGEIAGVDASRGGTCMVQ